MQDIIKERIQAQTDEIDRYFEELNEIFKEDSELKKSVSMHASSMLMLSIINSTIKIADDIVEKIVNIGNELFN